ncbi:MAG: uroporphyrinogen-III synthase [Gammaproteobacteria bacterium]|nr:uroporphyrinogen-III synthase [Gammaproteobacteria bacterium]
MTNMVNIDLQGLKILNPRPQHQAAMLSQMIHAAGGIAVELPTLEIESLSTDWLTTLPALSTVQSAVFVSANAVTHFFAGLHSQSIAWPDTIRNFAIGKGTAATLVKQKVRQITTPEHADSEHLLALPTLQDIQGQSVLLVTGERSRPLLSAILTKRGAHVQNVAVYRRARPKINLQFTHALWQDDAVDIILMLSQEAIENLFVLFEDDARNWLQSKPWIVISPRLVDIAHRYHVKTVLLSPYKDILTTLMGLTHEHGRNTR